MLAQALFDLVELGDLSQQPRDGARGALASLMNGAARVRSAAGERDRLGSDARIVRTDEDLRAAPIQPQQLRRATQA